MVPESEGMLIRDKEECRQSMIFELQVVLTLGIVIAQAINLGTQHIAGYGWRISLACAGLPAIVLTLGGLLLPDTPNSLIERGHEEQGKQVWAFCVTWRLFQGQSALRRFLERHCPALPFSAVLQPCRDAAGSESLWRGQVLRDIRGVENVEEEFSDIKAACDRAKLVVNPWRTILKPSYAPQLFVAITATLFQQVLFSSLWSGQQQTSAGALRRK